MKLWREGRHWWKACWEICFQTIPACGSWSTQLLSICTTLRTPRSTINSSEPAVRPRAGLGLLAQLLGMTQDALTLMSFGAALLVYSPWLLLLLAVTVLPSFLGETHFATLEYSLLFRYTPGATASGLSALHRCQR